MSAETTSLARGATHPLKKQMIAAVDAAGRSADDGTTHLPKQALTALTFVV